MLTFFVSFFKSHFSHKIILTCALCWQFVCSRNGCRLELQGAGECPVYHAALLSLSFSGLSLMQIKLNFVKFCYTVCGILLHFPAESFVANLAELSGL